MSFSSLVTATVTNLLKLEQMLMLSEGLNVFRAALNPKLDGQCLIRSGWARRGALYPRARGASVKSPVCYSYNCRCPYG